MDLARRVCSRDLKVVAMREIDGGRRMGNPAPPPELSLNPLQRCRGSGRRGLGWRAPASVGGVSPAP